MNGAGAQRDRAPPLPLKRPLMALRHPRAMRPSPASAQTADRRGPRRRPTTLRGKLFPGALDCVIADHSERGARLLFSEPHPAPDPAVLVIWSSGIAFEAIIRWRAGYEVGVEFETSYDLRRPAPPHLAEIKAQWLKRRPRLRRRQIVNCAAMIGRRAQRGSLRSPRPV